jgi:cytochrome c5
VKSSFATFLATGALLVPAGALADSGEEVVKARCSLCHEGGAGGAPRIGNRSEWEARAARGKLALYQTALKGKPNTAMMPRGGFRDLSNDEVMSAVDYMVARAGLKPGLQPDPVSASAPQSAPVLPPSAAVEAAAAPAEFDDKTATLRIAEALLAQLAPPGANIEMQDDAASVGGLGIRVATREGVVWLRGMVKTAEIIERAEAIAKSEGGGRKVENQLIAASLFEWD